jgi:hypothetical protein
MQASKEHPMDIQANRPATPVDAPAPRPAKTLLVAVLWCVVALCLYAANTVNALT